MNPAEIESELAWIKYNIKWPSENVFFSGEWPSKFFGSGFDYETLKPFSDQPYPKRINWAATDSSGSHEPLVRTFNEERPIPICLLVHLSKSADFGSKVAKRIRFARLCAALSYSAYRMRDMFTAIGYGDGFFVHQSKLSNQDHLIVARKILTADTSGANPSGLLKITRHIPRDERMLMVVLTDLTDGAEEWKKLRSHPLFASQRILPVLVLDERECDLPALGAVNFSEIAGKKAVSGFVTKRSRARLAQAVGERKKELSEVLGKLSELADSDEDVKEFARLFLKRRKDL